MKLSCLEAATMAESLHRSMPPAAGWVEGHEDAPPVLLHEPAHRHPNAQSGDEPEPGDLLGFFPRRTRPCRALRAEDAPGKAPHRTQRAVGESKVCAEVVISGGADASVSLKCGSVVCGTL